MRVGIVSLAIIVSLIKASTSIAQQPCPEDVSCADGHMCTCDDSGRMMRDELDDDGDGTPDYRTSFTYDDAGNLTRREADYDADDVIDSSWSAVYDEAGHMVREETDSDGDHVPNWSIAYTYDLVGNRLSMTYCANSDGEPTEVTTYTYDAAGLRVMREWDGLNGRPDQRVDARWTYSYDAAGNRVSETLDGGFSQSADGVVDQRCVFEPPCPREVWSDERCPAPTCR